MPVGTTSILLVATKSAGTGETPIGPTGKMPVPRIMKFSVNWLREFVELPSRVDELAELLTMAGIEIENIEKRGANFDNVVVAQINSFTQHPNADRLSVCDVDDGTNHHRQIVCGAKNFKADDKVPVALPGAQLPNGLKIKVSKLRGVESQGMLCSPSELLISQESDGLLILCARPRTAKSHHGGGSIIVTTYGLDDATFDRVRDWWKTWWAGTYEVIEMRP